MDNNINITVLGKGNVGKNELLSKYIHYVNPDEQDPTIEYKNYINLKIDNKPYNICILDSAGEDDFQNMMDIWISFAEGFLLVFAIEDKDSFEILNSKIMRIHKVKEGIVPMILVGNKLELKEERKVSFEEAIKFANSCGIEYIEISTTTNFNCKEAFEKLIIKIVSQNKKKKYSTKNIPKISYPGIEKLAYKDFYLKLKRYENY